MILCNRLCDERTSSDEEGRLPCHFKNLWECDTGKRDSIPLCCVTSIDRLMLLVMLMSIPNFVSDHEIMGEM